MNKTPESPCDFAKLHYYSASRWLSLWNLLVYVFGIAVVLFLVASILLFIRSSFLPGALTTLGTIVTGSGITWVVNQKSAAATEECAAFDRLKSACLPPASVPSSAQFMHFAQGLGQMEHRPSARGTKDGVEKAGVEVAWMAELAHLQPHPRTSSRDPATSWPAAVGTLNSPCGILGAQERLAFAALKRGASSTGTPVIG